MDELCTRRCLVCNCFRSDCRTSRLLIVLHRGAHPMVCDLLCSMTTMLARDQPGAYDLVFKGALQLASGDTHLQDDVPLGANPVLYNTWSRCNHENGTLSLHADCHQVLRLMCVPGALPAGTAAHVACFQAACIAAAASDTAMHAAPAAGNAAAPQPLPHCTLALHTVQHCEATLAAAVTLVALCAGRLQLVTLDVELQSALSLAMELMAFGHTELLQPAALAAAEELAPALPLPKLPAASLLQSVLAALDLAASSGRLASKTASSSDWRFRAVRLLQLCTDALAASGGLAPAAPGLVRVLCHASLAAMPGGSLQAELVHLLADIATVFPPVIEIPEVSGVCFALLPVGGAVAAALVRLLHVAQLQAKSLVQQHGASDSAPQVSAATKLSHDAEGVALYTAGPLSYCIWSLPAGRRCRTGWQQRVSSQAPQVALQQCSRCCREGEAG